jgi:hypothetical protein
MESLPVHLALHGAIVLMVGLLGGLAFSRAIQSGKGEVAWRVVHSGGCMGGVMLLAAAGVLRFVALPPWGLLLFAGLVVGGTYTLVAGMVVAAWTGDRGLGGGGSRANRVVHLLYLVGTVATLAGNGLLILGLARAVFS